MFVNYFNYLPLDLVYEYSKKYIEFHRIAITHKSRYVEYVKKNNINVIDYYSIVEKYVGDKVYDIYYNTVFGKLHNEYKHAVEYIPKSIDCSRPYDIVLNSIKGIINIDLQKIIYYLFTACKHIIKIWCKSNKLYRLNGPTIEVDNVGKIWVNNDQLLHREDGPAITYTGVMEEWYLNGKRHRVDGPAIIYTTGGKDWFFNGKRHRVDGPAIIYATGGQEWWLNGMRHRVDGPAIIYSTGRQAWYKNGKLHRVGGPAVIYSSGSKEWYINGKLHRGDGPAIIYSNGGKEWYLNGKLRKVSGPAVTLTDDGKE